MLPVLDELSQDENERSILQLRSRITKLSEFENAKHGCAANLLSWMYLLR
jgi:hypothetical protein